MTDKRWYGPSFDDEAAAERGSYLRAMTDAPAQNVEPISVEELAKLDRHAALRISGVPVPRIVATIHAQQAELSRLRSEKAKLREALEEVQDVLRGEGVWSMVSRVNDVLSQTEESGEGNSEVESAS